MFSWCLSWYLSWCLSLCVRSVSLICRLTTDPGLKALLFLVPASLESSTLQRLGVGAMFNGTQVQASGRHLLAAQPWEGKSTHVWDSFRSLLQTSSSNTTNATITGNTTNSTLVVNTTTNSTVSSNGTNLQGSMSAAAAVDTWTYLADYSTEAVPDVSSLDVPPLPPSYALGISLLPDGGNALQDALANMTSVVMLQGNKVQ